MNIRRMSVPLNDEEREVYGKELEYGEKAREALENVIKPYFEAKEELLISQFRECPIRDTEGQTLLRLQFQVLDIMWREMHEAVLVGSIAFDKLMESEETH